MTCPRCKGKGYEFIMLNGEPEKDICIRCNGEKEIEDDHANKR